MRMASGNECQRPLSRASPRIAGLIRPALYLVLAALDNGKQSLAQRFALSQPAVACFTLAVLGSDRIVAADDELTPDLGRPSRRDTLALEGSCRKDGGIDGHRRDDGGDIFRHAIDVDAPPGKVLG